MSATEHVEIGYGESAIVAALALPAGNTRVGAVVIAHEWWGLNDHMRDIAARFAAAGFVAIAADVYRGQVAKSRDEARGLMDTLPRARAIGDLQSTIEWVRHHPRCNGKVVLTGFCLGGALALGTACVTDALAGVVPFYGVPPKADYRGINAPVLMHVAETDDWVTPELAQATAAAIAAAGKPCELHSYPAQHAFFNNTRADVYDAVQAELAWQRTVAFVSRVTTVNK